MPREIFGYKVPDAARGTIVPGAPRTISGVAPRAITFPVEFGGYAIDVLVDNRDAVGNLTFRLNQRSGDVKTLGANGTIALSDQQIVLLDIVSGTNWEVTLSIVPL